MKKQLKQMVRAASLSIALLGFVSTSWADAAKDLQTKLEHIQTLKTEFSQIIMDDFGTVLDESKGRFELERPKKFRWFVEQPYEQEIVADGVSLWQFDRDIEQINVSALDDTLSDTPASLLSKAQVDVADTYNVTSVKGEAADTVMYHLTPKDESALFEVLVMEFDAENLKALKVKDNLGQTTLVEFSNSVVNQQFEKDYFAFVIPEGVDVIDSRENLVLEVTETDNVLIDPPQVKDEVDGQLEQAEEQLTAPVLEKESEVIKPKDTEALMKDR
ncbi:MAG: outer membrane lipoprotein chaperone LolA [Kangiellaceae bacterium]|nr:outer membrane lipoprotein chaperone LolA [Kangiellaceae bacterium]